MLNIHNSPSHSGPDLQDALTSRSSLDLMVVWTQAYDLWLESQRSSNTRRAYRMAWESFLDSTSKLPWEIGKSDVAIWVDHLRADRLSPATIRQRMAAVSSFYSYTMRVFTVGHSLSNFEEVAADAAPLRLSRRPLYASSLFLSSFCKRMRAIL